MKPDLAQLLEPLARMTHIGGREAVRRQEAGLTIAEKADRSVVTDADHAIEEELTSKLAGLMPDIPVIGEEAFEAGTTPKVDDTFFIIDAIDGTRAFSKGYKGFTVNVGLVLERETVAGVVYAPRYEALYVGAKGVGSFKIDIAPEAPFPGRWDWREISIRPRPQDELIAVVSHSNPDKATANYLSRYDVTKRESIGSSLKFCLVAEGKADIYPRMISLSEWDTAAGQAVAEAAGAKCLTPGGGPVFYGKDAFRHMPFVILGDIEPVLVEGNYEQ